jgi:hypothetical protein
MPGTYDTVIFDLDEFERSFKSIAGAEPASAPRPGGARPLRIDQDLLRKEYL